MKVFFTSVVIVGVAGFILFALLSQPSKTTDSTEHIEFLEGNEVEMVLGEERYEPREIRIKKGTTVTFSTTNNHKHWPASNIHPTHSIYSEFDPKRPLEADETWSFTFDQVGRWGLHDHLRPFYTGVIYVE